MTTLVAKAVSTIKCEVTVDNIVLTFVVDEQTRRLRHAGSRNAVKKHGWAYVEFSTVEQLKKVAWAALRSFRKQNKARTAQKHVGQLQLI